MIIVIAWRKCAWKYFLKTKHVRTWQILKWLKSLWGRVNLRWRDHRLKSQEATSSGKDDPGRIVGNLLDSQRPCFSSFCSSFSWMKSLALFSVPCSQSRAIIVSVLVFCRIYCFRILCFLFQCSRHLLNHFCSFAMSWLGIELSENCTFLTSGLTQAWCCSEFSLNVASAAEMAQ